LEVYKIPDVCEDIIRWRLPSKMKSVNNVNNNTIA
jgi:hypothetical protein